MSETSPPPGYKPTLLAILRKSLPVDPMSATAKITHRSALYRRRAAELARRAEAEGDELQVLPLVHQALSWISLAENEEILANLHTTRTGHPADA